MAVVNPASSWIARGVLKTVWSNLANGDTGGLLDANSLPDKTVTITGTFGAGGTVIIEGGISGTYNTLNDSRGEGNSLSFTSGDTRIINENPQFIRPSVTAGDGTTALTVTVISQSARR